MGAVAPPRARRRRSSSFCRSSSAKGLTILPGLAVGLISFSGVVKVAEERGDAGGEVEAASLAAWDEGMSAGERVGVMTSRGESSSPRL